jgi:hypothetical protein
MQQVTVLALFDDVKQESEKSIAWEYQHSTT